MVAPFVVVGSIALGAMIVASTVAIPAAIYDIIDKSGDKEDTSYIQIPDNKDVETGGFRLFIVNQAKSWDKAIRIYPDADVEEWTEVRCGNSSGKVAYSNLDIKFDKKRVDYKENGKTIKLALMKPGALGIWKTVGGILITQENRKKFGGKSIIIYFDDAGDGFFAGADNVHRLDAKGLLGK